MLTNPRLVLLYLRSRGVPYAATGLLVLVVLTGWDAPWLAWAQDDAVILFVFVAMLVAILLPGGFGSPSPELDGSAPLRWWRWRATHALAGLTISALPLAVVVGQQQGGGLDPAMVRNVLGFAGIALLTAVVAGARLAWTAPFLYALVAWLLPPQTDAWARAWRWPMLPADADLAWWPALGLCTLGALLIIIRGAAARSG